MINHYCDLLGSNQYLLSRVYSVLGLTHCLTLNSERSAVVQ